jgi:hypothetical protein
LYLPLHLQIGALSVIKLGRITSRVKRFFLLGTWNWWGVRVGICVTINQALIDNPQKSKNQF